MHDRWQCFRWSAVAVLALGAMGCSLIRPRPCAPSLNLALEDSRGRSVDRIEIGQTLSVGLRGLQPQRGYRVELSDERGRLVSFYQLTTDRRGAIPPSPVWYHSGVAGCSRRAAQTAYRREPYSFRTFEQAREALAGRTFSLTVRDLEGAVVARHRLPVGAQAAAGEPQVYFSDAEGCLMNSYVAGEEDLYLTAGNLPAGAEVQIFLVPNRYGWQEGTALQDVREEHRQQPQVVRLEPRQTSMTTRLWSANAAGAGVYDVVLRVNRRERTPRLLDSDFISYVQDTGTVVHFLSFDPPWTPGDFDVAGRLDRNYGYPYFEFHDTFEVGEEMWGAVDPGVVPAAHPGGTHAAYYVVEHGTAPDGLTDLTPAVEIVPIKTGCINGNMTRIWESPVEGEYDIVVDFGSTVADTPGDWTSDGTFNAGTDFIDRGTTRGAYVVPDPSTPGPYTVISHSYEPALMDPNDPLRTDVSSYFNSPAMVVTETMDNVPLRGVGHYPDGPGPFPLVLIVHGNHTPTHASHTGYSYLTSLLASHGMIAISIDENFLNGNVTGEMDARAIVLLRHLQRWRSWNGTAVHPLFNKVDLSRIGLAGHSRGGEAVIVANLFNQTLHNGSDPDHDFDFDLDALYAIAPVDGQIGLGYAGTPVVINDADYFIMHGSRDGDVFNFPGQKAYDRAFPNAGNAGGSKGLLFVHGANHAYWNEEWVHTDDSVFYGISSPIAQIGAPPQRDLGEVYVSGFFQWSLLGKEAYEALLTGDVSFGGLPSGVTLVHQYSNRDRLDLNNFEEDHDSATGTHAGVTNAGNLLLPFSDQDITGNWTSGTCTLSNPFFLWHQTSGLVAGWNSTSATYTVNLPADVGTLVETFPYLTLRIGQIYESPVSLNPAGAGKDLSLQLQLGGTAAHLLKVSNFDDLPYPAETTRPFQNCVGNVSKSVPKTVRIPLRSFIVNRSDWPLADISQIQIKFANSGTGLVVIDDVQLSK